MLLQCGAAAAAVWAT
ncbi:hypothetical protein A2U01_0113426, partial [Trifolium medium]|nr:hypothetical protein [Trifolium medium]